MAEVAFPTWTNCGGQGLSGGTVAEHALEAWQDCAEGHGGYVLAAGSISLQKVVAKIPCRPQCATDLGRLFAEPQGEMAIFLQMLRPHEDQVHFLYFWKAFGEAARTAGAVSIEAENLCSELEMLRDRILRRAEEDRLAAREKEGDSTASTASRSSVATEFSLHGLLQELERASAMSAYPEFWSQASELLQQRDPADMLTLEEVTNVLLSWVQDVDLWEHRQSAPVPVAAAGKAEGLRVLLHVYDVSQEDSIQKLNKVLAYKHFPLKFGGVFHAGVEVNGMEWCFGFSGSKTHPGVCCVEPKAHPAHHYRQTVDMGYTRCAPEEVTEIIQHMLEEYPGDDYDLLRRNCCHFADDFTRRMGVGGIPGWVMRLARIGAGVDSMIKHAPKGLRQKLGYEDDDSD
ncbi:unnamed protein product [Durusdinium trenchii]|uniref:PPPDE domain-containing protein n=1 Tax=Durusdinium trenchii TaxID=1381693 RepID=A0ABP0KBJ8_9DINO